MKRVKLILDIFAEIEFEVLEGPYIVWAQFILYCRWRYSMTFLNVVFQVLKLSSNQ